MVRSALASKPMGRQALRFADYVPAASVIAACSLSLLPIVSSSGWWPNTGLLILIAWRMLRADAWPSWWAAPMGFVNDLLMGTPLGLSVSLWTAIMLIMDLVDRRTQWRGYVIEWGVACLLIALAGWVEWQVAALNGAPVPLAQVAPAVIVEMLAFPIAAWLVARIDRRRLGR
ncbi:MAG: rod shape-determining protein MreD [Sphingomicrobium sp.]